jgi:predicted kinase
MFTTHDSFGHEKKMQATVIDTIEVNMGGGNIESRPVIELDIKFAGEDYKKIPFSVSDRSSNTNPILISKGFVENELEALIDVGAMNISHDKIDVVYGEGFMQGLKNVASGVKNVASGAKNFVKGGMNAAKKTAGAITNAHDKIGSAISGSIDWLKGGADKDVLKPLNRITAVAAGAVAGAIGSIATVVAKSLAKGKELEKSDKDKIRKQLPNLNFVSKYAENAEVSTEGTLAQEWQQTNFSKHPVISVAAFTCSKGGIASKNTVKGMEQRVENWKSEIKDEKEKIRNYRQQKDASNKENETEKDSSTEEDEESILNEAYMILEDVNQQQQG